MIRRLVDWYQRRKALRVPHAWDNAKLEFLRSYKAFGANPGHETAVPYCRADATLDFLAGYTDWYVYAYLMQMIGREETTPTPINRFGYPDGK